MAREPVATADPSRLQAVARDVWDAATTSRPISPPSEVLGQDLDAAYQVQDLLTLRSLWSGARVWGHKVTSLAGQPCFGVLFDAMQHLGDGPIRCGGFVSPRMQAAVGFVVGEDLTGHEVRQAEVPGVVSGVHVILEVVDSRIDAPEPTQVDLVADNVGATRFVLGAVSEVPEPGTAWDATLSRDGQVVLDGDGIVRPWRAFAWLTRSLRDRGLPLRAGEVVVVGGLTRPTPVDRAARWAAHIDGIGEAEVSVETEIAPWRRDHPSTRSCA